MKMRHQLPAIPIYSRQPSDHNPALLTFDEYLKLVNPNEKMHEDGIYQSDVKSLTRTFPRKSYDRLLKTVKINGLYFSFRLGLEKLSYLKDDGTKYTSDEIKAKKYKEHHYTIAVFCEDSCVAAATDEWGTLLVQVANEYRGFGLGPILTKLARTFEPAKYSGGFTPAGKRNFFRGYQLTVREALRNGEYSRLVRSGAMSMDRVREIVASASLKSKPSSSPMDLSISDPEDWLLMCTDGGAFVLYDKKLKDFYTNEKWKERFVFGYVLVEEIPHRQAGILIHFNGQNDKIKRFLLSCAASYCFESNIPLALSQEILKYIDPEKYEIGDTDKTTGYLRTKVKIKKPLNLKMISALEASFRKSFDRYGEFETSVLEIGEGKT